MKTILSLLLFVSLFSVSNANAQAFTVQAACTFNQAQGECRVHNKWVYPIYCELKAQGLLASGLWGKAFNNQVLLPGQFMYVYVNSQNPYGNPLVDVSGSAQCVFQY